MEIYDKKDNPTKGFEDLKIKGTNEEQLVFNLSKSATIQHRDRKTDLIKAKIKGANSGNDKNSQDAADDKYICFEIPEGRLDLIAKFFDKKGQFDYKQIPEKTYVYLGEILKDEEINFQAPKTSVNNYIYNMTQGLRKELAIPADIETPKIQNEQTSAEQKNAYEEELEELRKRRIRKPFLKGGVSQNEEIYDGVNLSNGEILRLRNVEKILKDTKGTYLYQANLTSTPDEYTAEDLSGKSGMQMLFTLPFRLDDIVNKNYDEEYKKDLQHSILEMLSKAYQERNEKEGQKKSYALAYAGGVDKNCRVINGEESRELVSFINNKIAMEQSKTETNKGTSR